MRTRRGGLTGRPNPFEGSTDQMGLKSRANRAE
jgi:hypothetical protein